MTASKSLSTKCRIGILLFIGLFSARAFAQENVSASEIMKDIKDGKNISYENVTIKGVLDFTYMDEKLPDLPERSKWWNNGNSNTVNESIGVSISFINCTFEDDVLAYIHQEKSGYTFIANFDKDVRFMDCDFNRNAMFKYSDFDRMADFEGTQFERKSTFKYAEFDEKANFANTRFDDDATFKYTEFDEGVSFMNAVFEESLNIKYMNSRGDFDIKGIKVRDDIDAKYTKVNGRSFNAYLLDNRN
ncbi:MAG: pentapeptide repeat-containing protein [Ekhidna sp.]